MTAEIAKRLAKLDKKLAKLIQKAGPINLKPKSRISPYESLVESVVYQQLHGKAAATIFARVKALYPHGKCPKPEEILATKDAPLRGAGLSANKLLAIRDLALKTTQGIIPTSREIKKLSDEEIIERLVSVRGVGEWTVHMLLIFKLGRPDVLPIGDYGVRKGFALTYGKKDLPTPKELLAYGERWKPYRTTAAWYLWRATDLTKTQPKTKTSK